MKTEIERIKSIRLYLLDLIKDLSPAQLNEIPTGFNNNIIWNVGHLLVSQQRLCYMRAGVKPVIDEQYLKDYMPTTKPGNPLPEDEINKIKELFLSVLDKLDEDYTQDLFSNYGAFTSPYGIELNNIDAAIDFLLFHEGLHMGYIMGMKRVLS